MSYLKGKLITRNPATLTEQLWPFFFFFLSLITFCAIDVVGLDRMDFGILILTPQNPIDLAYSYAD